MHTLIVDDEPLSRNELIYLLEQCNEITSIAEAESIEEALENMLQQSVDLIFLDIHLTNESGLTLANKVNQLKNPPLIIFATAYDEYAVKAFELNAQDYVLKPFELARIQQAVSKASQSFAADKEKPKEMSLPVSMTLPIQVEEYIYILKQQDIIAVEVENGITTIYTAQKKYQTREPLSALEKKLSSPNFMRVHRSYIVQLSYIKEIQPWFNHTFQVTMENQLKIPVSRFYMKEFKEQIGL
ncbi:LytTR family transcriptional regulator DNA-binding domain-containing protein [Carnobacterium funditum]|uniref:LytTR family transcriptional regulator DNA-binding domain-containing protein n=1 Tax=Carnobacterium funditum TaxID=2752 RepID=UPI0005543C82|nr:LytTR family transcriptional regulator DNA-binding domain-containing protein [Carnobacterium funditum]